jgi:hypothetical protein
VSTPPLASCSRYVRMISWISAQTLSLALIAKPSRRFLRVRVTGILPSNGRVCRTNRKGTCFPCHHRNSEYTVGTLDSCRDHKPGNRILDSVRSCSAPFLGTNRYVFAAIRESRLIVFSNWSLASVGIDDLLTAVLTLPEITTPQLKGRLVFGSPVQPRHFEELESVLLWPHLAITLHAHEHVWPSFFFEVLAVWTSDDKTEQHPRSAQEPLGVSYLAPQKLMPIFAAKCNRETRDWDAQLFALMQANSTQCPATKGMRFVAGRAGWCSPEQRQCMPRMVA